MSSKQKMYMSHEDIAYRRRMLERWGYVCIVCGHEFANLACVTKEHIVPRSKVKSGYTAFDPLENKAPSHYQCNQMRRDESFIKAGAIIEKKRRSMKHHAFIEWLNKKVPCRKVPPEALLPLHQPGFLELPEHVPGI